MVILCGFIFGVKLVPFCVTIAAVLSTGLLLAIFFKTTSKIRFNQTRQTGGKNRRCCAMAVMPYYQYHSQDTATIQ